MLSRAQKTLDLMLTELGQTGIETYRHQALNERDYGDLVGMNKDDARKKWGEEQVHIWRRSYDVQPPGGESLRDTGARVWPYFIHEMLPRVMRGDGVVGGGARQFAPCAHHGARRPHAENRARTGTGDRRTGRLPP